MVDLLRVVGGAERDRTDDLLLAKQALSQLSYSPFSLRHALLLGLARDLCSPLLGASYASARLASILVGLDGFEPSTPALSRRCSNQLSYRPRVRHQMTAMTPCGNNR